MYTVQEIYLNLPTRIPSLFMRGEELIPSRVQMCHFELGDKGTRGQGDKGERKLLLGMQLGISLMGRQV